MVGAANGWKTVENDSQLQGEDMAPIVAPGIARYAVHGSYSGRQVVNILDMKIDTTGEINPRGEALFEQAGRIINAWTDHILAWIVNNNYSANSVSWVDLDSLTGGTGERSATDQHSWPMTGSGAGDAAPGNVAIRVNKRTNAGRGSKQGRMYLCGLQENQTTDGNPNSLAPETITGANGKLDLFLDDVTANGVLTTYGSELHVVHTTEGEFTDSTQVIKLEIDGVLGSQRRRLR